MTRATPIRHLILDRDGVLNVEPATGWITRRSEWHWEEGVLETLARLTGAGIELSIATNQSCIGRGLVTAGVVDALHTTIRGEAAAAGARIARILVCPHTPEDLCTCRKPLPGLVLAAIAQSGLRAEATLLVGDAPRDLAAGRAAGVEVALVLTGKGGETARATDSGASVFKNLAALVDVWPGLLDLREPVTGTPSAPGTRSACVTGTR